MYLSRTPRDDAVPITSAAQLLGCSCRLDRACRSLLVVRVELLVQSRSCLFRCVQCLLSRAWKRLRAYFAVCRDTVAGTARKTKKQTETKIGKTQPRQTIKLKKSLSGPWVV